MESFPPLPQQIFIASDHAGYSLKQFLIHKNPRYPWEDLGVPNEETSDYPDQAKILCAKMNSPQQLGVLICGTGQGMAIMANRFHGVRAIVGWSHKNVCLAREHNNANILCLGKRLLSYETANALLTLFINTPFHGERHSKRIQKLDT